jgi:transcriptional regulator with PAS, ATPase and Fis domain
VLVLGESGTGKELVARLVHERSPRRGGPFVAINCAALVETLLESELFGHEKGAFTGAVKATAGKFEVANGGTVFLDEIGELSPGLQAKLLRVLQEKKYHRVGGTRPITSDARIVAATNRELAKAVKEGKFREDLYYRLSVIPIHLPPLRERREDIPLLARAFLERFRKAMEKPLDGFAPEAMRRLEMYDWPGNVRELENTIERAVALESGRHVSVGVLPVKVQQAAGGSAAEGSGATLLPEEGLDLEKQIQEMERAYLRAALARAGGVGTRAAELLRISYRSFKHYTKKYKLSD